MDTKYDIGSPVNRLNNGNGGWGGSHAYGEKTYGINIVAGREYTTRMYFWDTWDNERGELFVRESNGTNRYYFTAQRNYNNNPSTLNTIFSNYGTQYQQSSVANYNGIYPLDLYVDITFYAQHSGTLYTWTGLDQGTGDESLELNEFWETQFPTTSYASGSRSLSLITSSGVLNGGTKSYSGLANLTFTTDNNSGVMDGYISGSTAVSKNGTGTIYISGDNRYTGGTTVSAGTIILNDSAPSDGNGVIVGTLTVNQNATVKLTGNPAALGWTDNRVTKLNINGGTVEAINNSVQHLWNLTGGLNFDGGGTVRSNNGSSSATTNSYFELGTTNINVINPTMPAEISGRINLRSDVGGLTFTVADGTEANDLLISAAITIASAPTITKAGAGKLTISGSNGSTNTTTISAGVLQIGTGGTSGTLGTGSVINNASLVINRSDAYATNTVISGTGSLTKLGASSLTLSGLNTYTGATTISAGSLILERDIPATSSSSYSGAGTLVIQPSNNSFTSAMSYPITGFTVANSIGGLTLGKPTNTVDITFANTTTIAGPITAYGGTITLNSDLTTTNNGAISLYTDNPLGGLSTARTLTASGTFKYIPRGTAFTADVTYPITNLTATSTGLTIGKTTNDKNITITQDITYGAGIELYGANVNINANLKTTSGGAMYLKGNTVIAASKYIESNGNFTHDGNLTFKSNASGTAAFGPLGGTFNSLNSSTSTVERYIPAKRAYRFLSPSVTTTSTIYQNWQENGGSVGGLGTHITGAGGATNGFDTTTTNNSSLYTFNHSSGTWGAVTNTISNTLSAGTPYRLMVRGDRSISLSTNTPTATVTTLRATGVLKTGGFTPTLNQVSAGFSFVGNPYQAPVDIKAVLNASSNMNKDLVYYWDPTLNARGAYVTRTLSTTSFNSPESDFTEILQPGQAVFVKNAVTGTPSMTFNEINKVMTNSTAAAGIFRAATTNDYGMLRVNLKANVNNQWEVIEGALAIFHPSYSWGVTEEDANKFSNLDEEVSFMQNNTSLAIAMQSNPAITDELPMKLNNTRYTNYQWQFELTDYNGLTPYLLDTQNNTYTQIDNATTVPFTVNGQENTRFRIVFQNNALGTPTFDNQVVLYPNPASSSTSGFYLQGITTAEVAMHTLLGQKIPVQTTVSGTSLHVTIKQGLSKGVYIVSITQEGTTSQVKWIVE